MRASRGAILLLLDVHRGGPQLVAGLFRVGDQFIHAGNVFVHVKLAAAAIGIHVPDLAKDVSLGPALAQANWGGGGVIWYAEAERMSLIVARSES